MAYDNVKPRWRDRRINQVAFADRYNQIWGSFLRGTTSLGVQSGISAEGCTDREANYSPKMSCLEWLAGQAVPGWRGNGFGSSESFGKSLLARLYT
jgi:hypothetical protein